MSAGVTTQRPRSALTAVLDCQGLDPPASSRVLSAVGPGCSTDYEALDDAAVRGWAAPGTGLTFGDDRHRPGRSRPSRAQHAVGLRPWRPAGLRHARGPAFDPVPPVVTAEPRAVRLLHRPVWQHLLGEVLPRVGAVVRAVRRGHRRASRLGRAGQRVPDEKPCRWRDLPSRPEDILARLRRRRRRSLAQLRSPQPAARRVGSQAAGRPTARSSSALVTTCGSGRSSSLTPRETFRSSIDTRRPSAS